MERRIRLHNYLNGHVFSFVEYLLAAVVLAPFLAYYLTHSRAAYAIVASGVIFNCFAISAFALMSVLRGEQSIRLRRFARDRDLRKKVAIEHPNLSRDTLILSVTVLIPFWIFAAVLFDQLSSRAR